MAASIKYNNIAKSHLAGIVELCQAENWPSYSQDPNLTWKALTAPGATTIVAVESERVVGFAQMQSYGLIQAHLSLIVVAQDYRRQGIGTRLVTEAFARGGGKRIDAVTEDAQDFYRFFEHKEWSGFRIHPG
ncbi:hypothetical protein ES703_51182 [subsurface metagenome]